MSNHKAVEDSVDREQAGLVRYAARNIRVALSTTWAMRPAEGAGAA
jgi:hypothetical protein